MSKILLIYSTTDGHTKKISEKIQKNLQSKGETVTLSSVEEVISSSLTPFDKIVIGASIRYGKHHKTVTQFIKNNQSTLESTPTAFYSVNLVARKPEKCQPDTNPYLIKLLAELDWTPHLQGVFAGKLNYQKYGLLDRYMIRFIMWVTKGPTDLTTNIEFTNWESVSQFSDSVVNMP